MKKMYLFLIFLFSLLLISGCSPKRKTEKIENRKKLNFSEWAIENLKYENKIKKINCPEITENSFMSGSDSIFITGNNIYRYNVNKLFSNDKNCKLIGKIDKTNPIAVSRENAVDETGTFYNDFWQKQKDENYDGNYQKDTLHYGWKEYMKKFNINKKLISAEDNLYRKSHVPSYEIITYTNGELFLYNIEHSYDVEYKTYKVNTDSLNDEKIIKLYGSIIKTNKAFYTLSSNVINKEKCSKYADIKCDYEYNLKKDEILTKYYNEILNITNQYFITTDYKLIDVGDYYSAS